jgi:hypothetical protein
VNSGPAIGPIDQNGVARANGSGMKRYSASNAEGACCMAILRSRTATRACRAISFSFHPPDRS